MRLSFEEWEKRLLNPTKRAEFFHEAGDWFGLTLIALILSYFFLSTSLSWYITKPPDLGPLPTGAIVVCIALVMISLYVSFSFFSNLAKGFKSPI